MLETLTVDRLVSEVFMIGREASNADELFDKFANKIRETLGLDYVKINDAYQESSQFSGLEEFVINTNKPYLDNRLSGYSAFPELIKQYNLGYRSCMLLPVSVEGKTVCISTLLSKQEDKFDQALTSTVSLVSGILGYQAVSKIERERSINLARYFDAAFNTYVPQLLIDRGGIVVKANKSVTGLFAKSQKEMVGKNISDFFLIDANMLSNLRNGSAAEIRDNFDQGRVYKVTSSKISEKLSHVLIYDVTELKELEEKVKMAERSGNEALLLLAKDTTVLWVSNNIEKIAGIDKEEIIGKRLIDLAYTDKDFAGAIDSINEAYSRALRMNIGNDVIADAKVTLLRNRFGGFSCIMTKNNLEKYITNMQTTIGELVDYASDSIINIDELGYIKSMNKSAEKLLMYRSGEVANSAITMLYADSDSQQKITNSLSFAKNRGAISNVYVNMRTKEAREPLPCEQTIRSVIDQENKVLGYMIISRELMTKKKMNELEEMRERLIKQVSNKTAESQLKTQFLHNISHDLKTPLTNIKGYGKLLFESSDKLTDEQKEYINVITNESTRLEQLITQILDVAKLESGRIRLEIKPVNFNELVKNPTLETMKDIAINKGLGFSWNIDYDVPDVPADPNRLIQVFVNLIHNAIKFTDEGSISVKIIKKGRNVRVEVTDTGIGISKEDKTKLFRKFYQLQRKGLTMQNNQGTGLGLTIAKEIVNLHGGRINVIAEPGTGSTFWFTLPISGKPKKKETAKQ